MAMLAKYPHLLPFGRENLAERKYSPGLNKQTTERPPEDSARTTAVMTRSAVHANSRDVRVR